jgi:hypothetical protein
VIIDRDYPPVRERQGVRRGRFTAGTPQHFGIQVSGDSSRYWARQPYLWAFSDAQDAPSLWIEVDNPGPLASKLRRSIDQIPRTSQPTSSCANMHGLRVTIPLPRGLRAWLSECPPRGPLRLPLTQRVPRCLRPLRATASVPVARALAQAPWPPQPPPASDLGCGRTWPTARRGGASDRDATGTQQEARPRGLETSGGVTRTGS